MRVEMGTYVGDGNDNRSITGIGFLPDFLLIKSAGAAFPVATCTGFGSDLTISWDSNVDGNAAANQIQALEADGFQVGTDTTVNSNGVTYYYLAIQDDGAADFQIVTYTGNGADNRSITGAGFQPDGVFIISKEGTAPVWKTNTMAAGDNSQNAVAGGGAITTNLIQALESDGFQVGSANAVNQNTRNFFALCFKESTICSFLTHTGDGSAAASFTGVGFEPDFVWVKSATGAIAKSKFLGSGTNSVLMQGSAESTSGITTFDADGWTINNITSLNNLGTVYHDWTLREGQTGGVSGSGGVSFNVPTIAGISIVSSPPPAPAPTPTIILGTGITRYAGYVPIDEVTWRTGTTKAYGTATIRVPKENGAYSADILNPAGGMYIRIDDPILGLWEGVVNRPIRFSQDGAVLNCEHVLGWAASQVVSRNRVIRNVSWGQVIREALVDAMAGLGSQVLTEGTIIDAAPNVDRYEFRGQTFGQVIADAISGSGCEPVVRNATFSFVPPMQGRYTTWLTDGADVVDATRETNPYERVWKVIARGSNGYEEEATAGEAIGGFWQRVAVVQVQSTSRGAIRAAAEAELSRRRGVPTTFGFRLRPGADSVHWATIREGMLVQAILPSTALPDEVVSPLLRVLSRTYRDGAAYLDLTLQHIPHLSRTNSLGELGERPLPALVLSESTDPARVVSQIVKDVATLKTLV